MDVVFQYNLLKSLHIIFMTTWMAGLFYLPRLFVYHSNSKIGSEQDKTFQIMERKLIKYIMNPSLIGVWFLGIALIFYSEGIPLWLSLKMVLVFLVTLFHIFCIRESYKFKYNNNIKSAFFYRVINEIPTILFILIVFLVIFKPFV